VTAQAALTVVGSYTVRAGVYNEAGELIETLTFPESGSNTLQTNLPIRDYSLGPTTISSYPGLTEIMVGGVTIASWNGNGQNGNPVPNGNYYISLQSVNPTGEVTTVTRQVAVNRTLNEVSIQVFNEAGEVVRNLYAYTGNSLTNNAVEVNLSSSEFQPTSGDTRGTIPSQLMITLNTGTTVVWNGQSDLGSIVPSGQYYITVHIQDGHGGETVVTRQVTVMSQDATQGLGNLVAMPNIVNRSSPNGSMVLFETNSSQTLTLSYRIYDVAGELVKTRSFGPTGSNSAQWDTSPLASGCYFAVVDALNSGGGLVGRKVLKVVVVH
jgi:flagellar hook assembly protein FlgD